MLSFLRDQCNGDLPAQKPEAETEATPGDGTEKSQEQEFLTVGAPGNRSRKSTILLAVLFIVGLLCLGYMIKKSTPKAASAATDPNEESKLEVAIERITGVKTEMFSGMDEIVNKFHDFSNVLQVKVGELVKNPFELETLSVKEEPIVEINVSEIDVEKARQQRIRQKAKEMKLLSIMQSDRGKCCMIGDKILYEGDYVREFRVCQIGDNTVRLEWNPGKGNESSEAPSEPVVIMLNLSE
jgi:preprotein translocase subunit SecG